MRETQQNGGYKVSSSFGTYMLINAAYAAHPDGVDPVGWPHPVRRRHRLQGLKVTDTPRPVGGDLPYRRPGPRRRAVRATMGLQVVAIDIDDDKARAGGQAGRQVTVNAKTADAVAEVKATGGYGVLVTGCAAGVRPGDRAGQANGTIVFDGSAAR